MSILKQRDAFMLRRPDVIDLRYMDAKKYVDSVEKRSPVIEKFKNIISFSGIAWFIIVCLYFWIPTLISDAGTSSTERNGHAVFLNYFSEETRVIGCYNSISKTTREASSCTTRWDHNILLPDRKQIEVWLKYYNERQIINRLALVNFESAFRENVWNPHAFWYVQTLRSHWIAPDINSQLAWMSNREKIYRQEYFHGRSWRLRGCGFYWKNANVRDWFQAWEDGVLGCLYRYHYDANKGSWYAQRWILVTHYYRYYLLWEWNWNK